MRPSARRSSGWKRAASPTAASRTAASWTRSTSRTRSASSSSSRPIGSSRRSGTRTPTSCSRRTSSARSAATTTSRPFTSPTRSRCSSGARGRRCRTTGRRATRTSDAAAWRRRSRSRANRRARPRSGKEVRRAHRSCPDPDQGLHGREPGRDRPPCCEERSKEGQMTSADLSSTTAMDTPKPGTVDMALEVVTIPVSDVDRSKRFYERIGWRLDADIVAGDVHVLQFTPPHSQCSIHFGTGLTAAAPGSADRLVLAVKDIEAARHELIGRGVEVSEAYEQRPPGFESIEGRSYFVYADFQDPDGNRWLLQEVTMRLPGREWDD